MADAREASPAPPGAFADAVIERVRALGHPLCVGIDPHLALIPELFGGGALRGGMPFWKYVSNRFLTASENLLLGAKLSEYHTGYRAFSRTLLERLPLEQNSDDFVFDNQMLAQIWWTGATIAEVSCPTKYFPEASSINFPRSVKYGLGCLTTASQFLAAKWGLSVSPRFPGKARSSASE